MILDNFDNFKCIDKTENNTFPDGYFETTFKQIRQLMEKQLKTQNQIEYKEIGNLICGLFKLILLHDHHIKRYFIKGSLEERKLIIYKFKIISVECIEISNEYEEITAFNKLAGMKGNIIWLTEETAELWSFSQLIKYLV